MFNETLKNLHCVKKRTAPFVRTFVGFLVGPFVLSFFSSVLYVASGDLRRTPAGQLYPMKDKEKKKEGGK